MRALHVLRDRSAAHAARVEAAISAEIEAGAGLAQIAAAAHGAVDRAVAGAIARGAGPSPACAAGCSWCCHVHVDATAPEILAAAAHLAASHDPAALAAIRARLAAHVERVEGLDDLARWSAKIPCAMLASDGRCSIYEARPLRCRAFHASSAAPCEAAFTGDAAADPATIPAVDRAARAAESGFDRALAAARIPAEALRFEVGLLVALGDPGAEAKLRAGEPVFRRAAAR